ncbi:MAG: InlB B-repeat-containing protein [Clostridia bacterium]|nr:InlB B-repeat-containing protein [Clostridia bacterium]
MIKRKSSKTELEGELHEVSTAGFKTSRRTKRDKTVNRRAGLHDKNKYLEGEVRVKRRKPLALKHVRRMRKVAAVSSLAVVGAIAVVGVGFFSPKKTTELSKDLKTVCYEVPSDGTRPTDHTLVENVGYLNYVLQNQEYWSSEMFSTVYAMGFSQTVETYKQYYDGVLISADIAKGFSQKANQFCVYDGIVMWRPSANTNFDKMNTPWSNGDAQGMTIKSFKMNRGFPPSEFSVYVLNENTIANANDYSVVDNGDGTFSMTLNLNVNTGVDETSADYYYKLQMKVTGDLYDCPPIKSTSVTYTFDANWRVLSFDIADEYTAPIAPGVNIGCSSETAVKFDYGYDNAVNSYWEDYFSKEYDRLKDTLVDGEVIEENADNALGYLAGAFTSVLTDGAIFKVDLTFDDLKLNGAVCVEMENGGIGGVSVKLGDILVWLEDNTLYINDGNSKYKLDMSALTGDAEAQTQSEEEGSSVGGLNVSDLMDQLTAGTFTLDEVTGIATLQSELELFGLKINLFFEFEKSEAGIALNYVTAEIPLGEKVITAKLCFGEEKDKPVLDKNLNAYTDILNDGVTLNINAKINGLNLDGIAKIIMQNGTFNGLYLALGNFGVYYDCPRNMLYLTDGNVKYKLDISAINTGSGADLSGIFEGLDITEILGKALAGVSASENGINTDLALDLFEQTVNVALSVNLKGGLGVGASLNVLGLDISLGATLTNEEVVLPDFTAYKDILNSEITLDVNLTLLTGNINNETGKRNEVALNGKVCLCLKDGNINGLRADFGSVAVYYETSANALYLNVGTTKLKVDLEKLSNQGITLSKFLNGNGINIDLPAVIIDLIDNLAVEANAISASTSLTLLDAIIPLSAKINIENGISVEAQTVLLGIDATLGVNIATEGLDGLSADQKAEYLDVLTQGKDILDSLLGDHISASVEGKLYVYDNEKYTTYGFVKYDFEASLELDRANVLVDGNQITVDDSLYLHLNIALKARSPQDDSLYLDLIIMNANPVTGASGKTSGGYTTPDQTLDVYVSVSKTGNDASALKIYAPADDILNIVSMLGATLNLKGLSFTDADINNAVKQIAGLLDDMLINNSLPKSVQDKFASLGDSLIPQILGVSLQDFLDKLIVNATSEVDKAENRSFLLSDEYVQSITNDENSLKLVLNSSLIYETQIAEEDNLTVNFVRKQDENGVYLVDFISLNNIFFGDNNVNKIDIRMDMNYGEIEKPSSSDGLKNYLNASGLNAFLNAMVNSATHKTTEEEKNNGVTTQYSLNKNYYIAGDLTLGLFGYDVTVNLKGLSVTIGDDNNVSFDVSYRVNKKALVISDTVDIDLSVRNDMMYIKRTVGGKTTVRIMPASEFAKNASALKDNLNYMFNFSSLVSGILNSQLKDDSLSNKAEIKFNDYGDYLSSFITKYVYSINSSNESVWALSINGSTVGSMVGVTLDDINVNFFADPTEEGYILKRLTLDGKMFGIISFKTTGNGLILCNPADSDFAGGWTTVSLDGITVDRKLTCDVANDKNSGVDGYSWAEILGGTGFEEISKHVNWPQITADLGKDYVDYTDGCDLGVATLKYEYPVDGGYAEFGNSQLVIYNKKNASKIYTYLNKPSLSEVPKVANKNAVWAKSYVNGGNGEIILRVRYETTYKVTILSQYKTNADYSLLNDGNYGLVIAEAYGTVLLPKDVLVTMTDGSVYKLKGYLLDGGNSLYGFSSTEKDESGKEYYVATVESEMTFTAVWEQVYAVNFVTDDGVITEYYYAGETLTEENMPTVPVKDGYSGSWVGALGTQIIADTEYEFNAEYVLNYYTVTLQSSLEVKTEGFTISGEVYQNANEYVYGYALNLTEPESVSSAYYFGGWYNNAGFTGEPVTEVTVGANVTYYAKWIGKKITVNYLSDLSFADSKEVSDGDSKTYTTKNATVLTYGVADKLLIPAVSDGNVELLGWFMPYGESYKYFSSADDIKTYFESIGIDGDSVEVTLWAVWTTKVTVNITNVKSTIGFYTIGGGYEWSLADGVSSKIAEAVNFKYSASVYYRFYKVDDSGKYTVNDTLNSGKAVGINQSKTFSKGSMTTVKSTNYAGATVEVTLTWDGGSKVLTGSGCYNTKDKTSYQIEI